MFSILAVTLVIFFYAPQFAGGLAKVGREVFANSTDWSLASPEDVVNPGSYVVIGTGFPLSLAMRYDPDTDHKPFVLAKGQDFIALKIREIAEENDIPVIEDKPLARSVYKACSVDQVIPVEFYVPIAHIVRTLREKG